MLMPKSSVLTPLIDTKVSQTADLAQAMADEQFQAHQEALEAVEERKTQASLSFLEAKVRIETSQGALKRQNVAEAALAAGHAEATDAEAVAAEARRQAEELEEEAAAVAQA